MLRRSTTLHVVKVPQMMQGLLSENVAGGLSEAIKRPVESRRDQKFKTWDFEESMFVKKNDKSASAQLKQRMLFDRNVDPVLEADKLHEEGYAVGQRTLTVVLATLKKQGRTIEAVELARRLSELPDFDPKLSTNEIIAMVYAQAGNMGPLLQHLDRVKPPLNVVNEMALHLADAGRPCRPLIEKMSSFSLRPDEIMYRTVISRHPDADEREVLRAHMKHTKIEITSTKMHSMLLAAGSKRGDPVAAREGFTLLTRMIYPEKPTEKHWTMLLQAYAKAGDLADFKKAMTEFKESGRPISKVTERYMLQVALNCYKNYIATCSAHEYQSLVKDAETIFATAAKIEGFVEHAKYFVSQLMEIYATARQKNKIDVLVRVCAKEYGLTSDRELNIKKVRQLLGKY
eukprot:TRINITY_DN4010_c0_g1_i1.p1 TRINITY_DN4010_c0_g1~~TRINITY_DN4010_c0_g1_i1.p1  ORF type:complete len:401 (+),score=54.28 TRINITY_DN4010_c0_g1_i1:659-1861(+)